MLEVTDDMLADGTTCPNCEEFRLQAKVETLMAAVRAARLQAKVESLMAVVRAAADVRNDHDDAEVAKMTTSIRFLCAAVDAAGVLTEDV